MFEINIEDRLEGVNYVEAGTVMRLMVPRLLVIHYTVTRTASAAVNYFRQKDAPASAHLVIDRDGTITQMVPFDRTAAHAGKSSWKGVESCNRYSIGIELVNMGPLKSTPGGLADWYSRPIVTETFRDDKGKLWEAYPEAQFFALAEASKAICDRYGIKEIVGHSDISPGRKIDPGPALDMSALRKLAGVS